MSKIIGKVTYSFFFQLFQTLPLAVCEGIGMGIFTFVVTGVVVGDYASYGLMTIWLTLAFTISIFAPTTGGHINPAVTFTLLLCGLFGGNKAGGSHSKKLVIVQVGPPSWVYA